MSVIRNAKLAGGPRFRVFRRRCVNAAIDGLFATLATAGRLHPLSRAERAGIDRRCGIPYRDTGDPAHRLDVYLPLMRAGSLPVVLYIDPLCVLEDRGLRFVAAHAGVAW